MRKLRVVFGAGRFWEVLIANRGVVDDTRRGVAPICGVCCDADRWVGGGGV